MAATAKALMSADEFFAIPDLEERSLELDEGELIEMPRPMLRHARVCMKLSQILSLWVEKENMGTVVGSELAFTLDVDRRIVRAPDCAVLLGTAPDGDRRLFGGPTIAIEVVSPGDSAEQIERKRKQYLAAGTKEVWVAYPRARSVELFTLAGMREFAAPEILRSDLLPGLEIPLETIFPA